MRVRYETPLTHRDGSPGWLALAVDGEISDPGDIELVLGLVERFVALGRARLAAETASTEPGAAGETTGGVE